MSTDIPHTPENLIKLKRLNKEIENAERKITEIGKKISLIPMKERQLKASIVKHNIEPTELGTLFQSNELAGLIEA